VAVVAFSVDDAHVLAIPPFSSARKINAARRASVALDIAKLVDGLEVGTPKPSMKCDFVDRAFVGRRGHIGVPIGYPPVPWIRESQSFLIGNGNWFSQAASGDGDSLERGLGVYWHCQHESGGGDYRYSKGLSVHGVPPELRHSLSTR
jgi:hypothetical protein